MGDLPGPSLLQWARARDWPEPGEQDGPLVGRSITEGTRPVGTTLEEPSPAPGPPAPASGAGGAAPPQRGASRLWVVGGALAVVAAILLCLTGGELAAAAAGWALLAGM